MRLIIVLSCLTAVLALGCGGDGRSGAGEKTVLRVNDLQLTRGDLQEELRQAERSDHSGTQAESMQLPRWLDRTIERELLVQEAQRQGLDRRAEFMKSIERYWKQALIKQLLDQQSQEIISRIRVYEPEIEAFYKQLSEDERSGRSLSEMRNEMSQIIRLRKQGEAMEEWMEELRSQARIEIDQEAIQQLR